MSHGARRVFNKRGNAPSDEPRIALMPNWASARLGHIAAQHADKAGSLAAHAAPGLHLKLSCDAALQPGPRPPRALHASAQPFRPAERVILDYAVPTYSRSVHSVEVLRRPEPVPPQHRRSSLMQNLTPAGRATARPEQGPVAHGRCPACSKLLSIERLSVGQILCPSCINQQRQELCLPDSSGHDNRGARSWDPVQSNGVVARWSPRVGEKRPLSVSQSNRHHPGSQRSPIANGSGKAKGPRAPRSRTTGSRRRSSKPRRLAEQSEWYPGPQQARNALSKEHAAETAPPGRSRGTHPLESIRRPGKKQATTPEPPKRVSAPPLKEQKGRSPSVKLEEAPESQTAPVQANPEPQASQEAPTPPALELDGKPAEDAKHEIDVDQRETIEPLLADSPSSTKPGTDQADMADAVVVDDGEMMDVAEVADDLLSRPLTASEVREIEMLPQKQEHGEPAPVAAVLVENSYVDEGTHIAGEALPFPTYVAPPTERPYEAAEVVQKILREPIIKLQAMLFHASVGTEEYWEPFDPAKLAETRGGQEIDALIQDRYAKGWDVPLPQMATITLDRYVQYMQSDCHEFRCPKDATGFCSKAAKPHRPRGSPAEDGSSGDVGHAPQEAIMVAAESKEESEGKRARCKPEPLPLQGDSADSVLFAVPGKTSSELQQLNFGFGSSRDYRYLSYAVSEMQEIYIAGAEASASQMRLVTTEKHVLVSGDEAKIFRCEKDYVMGLMMSNWLLCLGPFTSIEGARARIRHPLFEKCTVAMIKYLEADSADRRESGSAGKKGPARLASTEEFLRFSRGLNAPGETAEAGSDRKKRKLADAGTRKKEGQSHGPADKSPDRTKRRRSRPRPVPILDTTSSAQVPKGEKRYVLFGSNVDMGAWASHNALLRKALPDFLVWQGNHDLLSLLRQHVPGMDLPQLYMKVPGVWTGGHEENNRFRSININHGPGDCEWWAVEGGYTNRVRQAVLREEGIDIFATEGQWMPDEAWFAEHGIPILRTRQRKGDVITLKGETLHWVRALGVCVCSSWNYGIIESNQLEQGWERYRINATLTPPMQNNVPMKTLSMDLAKVCVAIASRPEGPEEGGASKQASFLDVKQTQLSDLLPKVLEHLDADDFAGLQGSSVAGLHNGMSSCILRTLGTYLCHREGGKKKEADAQRLARAFPNASQVLRFVPMDVLELVQSVLQCIVSEAAAVRGRMAGAGYAMTLEAPGAMVLHCEAPGCNAELFQNYMCCSTCIEKRSRYGRTFHRVLESDEFSEMLAGGAKGRRGRPMGHPNPKPRPMTAAESRELSRVSDHVGYMCEECSWKHYSGRAGEARRGHLLEAVEKAPLESLAGLYHAFTQLVEAAAHQSE